MAKLGQSSDYCLCGHSVKRFHCVHTHHFLDKLQIHCDPNENEAVSKDE